MKRLPFTFMRHRGNDSPATRAIICQVPDRAIWELNPRR
ncbi:hypothetical protein B4135_4163 [Caldibacillus debilis]|uniref:Uncharacterized protein n=1 Tax=Caldibacillus debilis TaxID=301148 RepID=A0A150L6Q9_9BACI|nr:hypothetical protein B4135_4163 [Caldibacillus debilis]